MPLTGVRLPFLNPSITGDSSPYHLTKESVMARTYTSSQLHAAVLLLTDIHEDKKAVKGLTKQLGFATTRDCQSGLATSMRCIRLLWDYAVPFKHLKEE